MKLLLLVPFLVVSATNIDATKIDSSDIQSFGMQQNIMEQIVKGMAQDSSGENGVVEFNFRNVKMYLVSDVKHNRMRIIAPIADYTKLERQHIDAVLQSNFHKALDARYAVSEGVLYSAYIHSMKELTKAQIESAVSQVANLALSFGGTYSSGELTYGGDQ